MFRPSASLLVLTLLAACAPRVATPHVKTETPVVTLEPAEPWREAMSGEDAARIDGIAAIWRTTLDDLPRRAERNLDGYGSLLAADAALDHPALTPGSYSCRVVRVGSSAGAARLRAYPSNFCYVAGDAGDKLSFTKQTGSDLPAGQLYADGDKRYVFVGAKQKRAGDNSTGYGTDGERDAVGVVERVGSFRWRLVVPAADGHGLDVYELTPTPSDQQPD